MEITILSVDGLGKLKTAIHLLLQHNKIDWQGSLEKTFKHYFSPSKLKPTQEVWENIAQGKVNSLFQLNTPVGQSAVKLLKVSSVQEMGMVNSIMRLQPQNKGDKQPLEIFHSYRENISLWYDELKRYGLLPDEIAVMEKHLLPLSGIADTQESLMLISMDPKVAGFSVKEANFLRKSIARKNPEAQEEVKKLFYEKGLAAGTRTELLDYVWQVQVHYSLGYAFSLPHVAAYSYIALQEACIYTQFPSLFWNTACLIDDAGAFAEEDFPDLIELGYIDASDKYYEIEEAEDLDEVEIETTAIDRDKIATSIAMFQETVSIEPPDINVSGFGFTLSEETDSIQTGLKVVSMLGNRLIYEIIKGRPYESFEDFLSKTKIPKNRVAMLIKSGAFRNITDKSTIELLKEYVWLVSGPKTDLNGRNIQMLIRMNLIPNELDFERRAFNWWKYLQPARKIKPGYVKLDAPALRFFEDNYDVSKIEYFNDGQYIPESYGKAMVDRSNEKIKTFIRNNKATLLDQVNKAQFDEWWEKYGAASEADAEMNSLRMYTKKHPLSKFNMKYDKLTDLKEDNFVGYFNIRGKVFPKYYIYRIVGTVVAKEKSKEMITLLTPEGAIKIKMWKDIYNLYDRKSTTVIDGRQEVIQGSFFEVGTHLVVFGTYRDGMFFPKVYKDTGVRNVITKINIDGNSISLEEKVDENNPS